MRGTTIISDTLRSTSNFNQLLRVLQYTKYSTIKAKN